MKAAGKPVFAKVLQTTLPRQTFVFIGEPPNTDNRAVIAKKMASVGKYLKTIFVGKSVQFVTSTETKFVDAMQALREGMGLGHGVHRCTPLDFSTPREVVDRNHPAVKLIAGDSSTEEVIIVLAHRHMTIPNRMPLGVAALLARPDVFPSHRHRFGLKKETIFPYDAFIVHVQKGTSVTRHTITN